MLSKRLLFIAVLPLFVLAGCGQGKKVPDAPPPVASSPSAQTEQPAPYGSSTDVPSSAPRAEMLAFVDADRGSDFVAHGTLKLPGTDPAGREVPLNKFIAFVPATDDVRKALAPGKSVQLSGRYENETFVATGFEEPQASVPPTPEWRGWGYFGSPQGGKVFECRESAALTDWVGRIASLSQALGVPCGGVGNLDEYFSEMEEQQKIPGLKYQANQTLKAKPLVHDSAASLAGLRSLTGKFGFVTSANALENLLVRKADVSEDDVFRFMEAARSVPCGGEGPHAEAPATVFGYAFRPPKSEIVYVCGVEGDSFSEWMRIFRSGAGSGVTWKAAGVPEELVSKEEERVYCWFAGQRVKDQKMGEWWFAVNSTVTERQYGDLLEALKRLFA